MKAECDWKVTAFLIWCALSPFICMFGFATTFDKLDEIKDAVREQPTVVSTQPVCIRSENKFGWWSGRQEVNCGQ